MNPNSWIPFLGGINYKLFVSRSHLNVVYKGVYYLSSVIDLKAMKQVSQITKTCIHANYINTLRSRQNGRHFADDTFKRIFLNENIRTSIKISLKFVPKGSTNNIPVLVQIMAWCQSGNKPLSEPMMARLPTHICVTRPLKKLTHWSLGVVVVISKMQSLNTCYGSTSPAFLV